MAVSETTLEEMGSAEELKTQGNMLYAKKQYQEAHDHYVQAISIHENFKEAWFNRGMCCIQLKQTSEAIASFRRALEIDPTYEKARYQLNVSQLSAHILFGIVDLKFTSNHEVKLLEFGIGLLSDFSGYDRLYPEKPMLEGEFIPALEKIKPSFTVFNEDPQRTKKALDGFSKWHHSSEAALPSRKLSDYKGIFFEIVEHKMPQTPNKDILVLDNSAAWRMVAHDKYVMYRIIDMVQPYPKYRPQCKAYPLRYENDLANRIKASIPANIYVLKAPDLSRGEGVIIVQAEDLDRVLQVLLRDKDKNGAWRSTKSKVFLVEEYCQSKEFRLQDKIYDPTMRVAFLITVDEGRPSFKALGCYWKLPKTPLSEGSLSERTISHITPAGLGSAKVSLDDQKEVYKQLSHFLPQLFLRILIADIPKMIEDLKTSPDDLIKEQANVLRLLYTKMLIISGEAEKAFESIKTLKSKDPSRYYIGKAGLYCRSENFEKVIKKCNRLLKLNPSDGNAFFLRAAAHKRLGNLPQAHSDYTAYKRFSAT